MSRSRKLVTVELISPDSDVGRPMYALVSELIERWHEELTPARIALAWNRAWKPDADGRLTLGKCKRATDLDRELHAYDFVILLNQDFWSEPAVTNDQRRALLDHELSHAMPAIDADGEQLRDEKDRPVWRLRGHDIEEFAAVVARHGTYKRDLEAFARALRIGQAARAQGDLFVN